MSGVARSDRRKPSWFDRHKLHWTIALAASALLVLPIELGRRHYAAHTLPGRVVAGVLAWLTIAGLLGAIIYLVAALARAVAKPRPRASRAGHRGHAPAARHDEPQRAWPQPTARSRRWTVRYAILALIASQVLLFLVALGLWASDIRVPRGAGGLLTEAIFLSVLVPLYRSGRLRPRDLGLRRAPGAASVGLAIASLIAIGVLEAMWSSAVRLPRTHTTLVGIAHKPVLVIVLAGFAAAIAAPVVEEVFFRGFLYRSLRNRLPIIPAALLVGVIFGLGHTQYPLLERPNQALFGFVTCLLYERTGSLLPGIAIHSFIDASGFEAALTGTSWIVLVIFLALAGAILIKPSLRALRRLFSRGGRVVTE